MSLKNTIFVLRKRDKDMAKKIYTIQYSTQKFYTINIEAERIEDAYKKAEEAWCNYDDYDWEEYETQTCADIISISK